MPPDGAYPAKSAVDWLRMLDPDILTRTTARCDRVEAEIADLIDMCREDEQQSLDMFITLISRKIQLRNALEFRLRDMGTSTPVPARKPVEVEVCHIIRSIRRWKSGDALRSERLRRIDQLKAELAAVELDLVGLAGVAERKNGDLPTSVASGYHKGIGLVSHEDEWLRRAESLIARRTDLRQRIIRLDSVGDGGRARLVAEVIAEAGGPERVAQDLGPTLPGLQADVSRLESVVSRLEGEESKADPETRRAAVIREDLATYRERLARLREESKTLQTREGRSVVQRALEGSLLAIGELARLAGGTLASALQLARGNDSELEDTTKELIAATEPKAG
jgi:hypothetical protein